MISCTLVHFYSLLRRHAVIVYVVWGLFFATLALLTFTLRLDTGSAAFFPDSPPDVGRMAADMDMAPFSRLLFVDLHLPNASPDTASGVAERLARSADAVLAAIPADLAVRAGVSALPAPESLLALLPSVLPDTSVLAVLGEPQAADTALRTAKERLRGLPGTTGLWIQADPFNLGQWLFPALPLGAALPLADPIWGHAFSPDKQHVLLVLRPTAPMHDVDAAIRFMDVLSAALQNLPADMTATVVGGHRHTAVNSTTIMTDIERIAMLSLVGFVLVYLVLVRSPGALWLVLVPGMAAICATGAMTLAWPVVSGLALGFGASVLGLAEDYAVHVHFALRTRSDESPAHRLAVLTPPLVQSLLLNCAGFAVLLFSGIPAVRQLAFFAMSTLVAGLVLALTLLPLCPWSTRNPLAPDPARGASRVPQRPMLSRTVLLTLLLLGALGFLYPRVAVDVSPRTLGADMIRLEADAARLQAVWGDALQTTVFVAHAPDMDKALAVAHRLSIALRTPAATSPEMVLTLTDLLPPAQIAQPRTADWQTQISALSPAMWDNLERARQTHGFAASAFAPFRAWITAPAEPNTPERLRAAGLGDLVDMFLRTGPGESRVLVMARGVMPPLPPDLRDCVVQLSPQSLETSLHAAMQQESRLLPVVLGLVVLLLVLCLRRPSHILLAALPPLAALTGVVAWLYGTGTPFTLASMTALPLMLSLAMDHGLVVTHDLAEGASMNIERSMLVSSLTSILGMGLLALAVHPALRGMGQVIAIGLVLEFSVARWVLPRLCKPVHGVDECVS